MDASTSNKVKPFEERRAKKFFSSIGHALLSKYLTLLYNKLEPNFRKIVLYNGVGKRGETLKHVIFVIIAFILAIPILLILPIGLSWSGKIAALIIALFLSLLSLVAKSFFPMWQLALLLGLLMIAMTYLLHRQFAHVFYAAKKLDEDEWEEPDEPAEKSFSSIAGGNGAVFHQKEAVEAEQVPLETAPQAPAENSVSQKNMGDGEQDEIIAVDELPLEIAADAEREETMAENEFPWEKDTEQSEMIEMRELPLAAAAVERQIETITESEFPWETIEDGNENEAAKLNEWPVEMETNEEWGTDLPFADLPEMEENVAAMPNHAQETAARDDEKDLPHISLEKWMISTDDLADEESGVEWDDILAEMSQPPVVSDKEEVLPEETDAAVQPHIDELLQEEQSAGSGEEVMEAKEDNADETELASVISPVHSEILQTIVTELQLNRKYMNPLQYEQRIIQCLQTPLPDYDYYVFARLLIEHYLLEKQYDKLSPLLAQLQEKFQSYPIIKEELQFLAHILQL